MQITLPLIERKVKQLNLRNKKVLVVGLGKSGSSAAKFLIRRGAKVTVTDILEEDKLKEAAQGLRKQGAHLELGEHRMESFVDCELIILSPGVPKEITPLKKAQQKGIPIISEVELAYRFCKGKIIAVTGSNGKTTTVSLLGKMMQKAGYKVCVAGNIGKPFIELLNKPRTDYYVVELSSFQLETIEKFKPDISLLLNITPDHMDRYPSFSAYAEAKRRIFLNQTRDDMAILNADDPACQTIIRELKIRNFLFSRQKKLGIGIYLKEQNIVSRIEGQERIIIPIKDIKIKGVHNIENIMAAAAVGIVCEIEREKMRYVFSRFSGLEHRMEKVTTIEGVTFYNDSKATNIDAVSKALQSFDNPIILLMGGRDKGGDFTSLAPLIKEKVKLLLLIGEASGKIASSLSGIAPIMFCRTFYEAIEIGFSKANPEDVFLLSPGCTSFDMFNNFEERGEHFKREVIKFKNQRKDNAQETII